MARTWKTPFAALGDKNVVPSSAQLDGSVSVPTGWTPDYQLEYADPDAKDISRADMNGILHDVTEAIGEIQTQGLPSWSDDAAPYPIYARVYHNIMGWRSAVANNSTEPGVGASWIADDSSPTEAVRGMPLVATQAETNAGTDDAKVVTPKKLRAGFSIMLGQSGFIAFPTWMGGLILQWVTSQSVTNGTTYTLPTAFPNNFIGALAGHFSTGASGAIAASVKPVGLSQYAIYSSASTITFFAIGN